MDYWWSFRIKISHCDTYTVPEIIICGGIYCAFTYLQNVFDKCNF